MSEGAFPLVSVVIPCYNAGVELDEAVRSALAQTWPSIEVIVVDDGSTNPATLAMLHDARWPRTRILHKGNGGPASARNMAIRNANGQYILPLDADDLIDSTYVEKAVRVLASRPEVGIVYCRAMKFGAENGPWELPPYTLRELVIDNVIFVTSLFRREDWERVGGFSESLKLGVEDYDFWVKIVALGREVHQIDEFLFHYRVGHLSRTTGFSSDRTAIVKTYAEIFRGNRDFYARHAEYIFEHRFGMYDELLRYRSRYGSMERFLVKHPRIAQVARFCHRWLLAGK